jgi:dsRNA-specific ribonuclease
LLEILSNILIFIVLINFFFFGGIFQDTVFCKSILNEFASKMNLEQTTYGTVKRDGLLPVFISSLVFDAVSYTSEVGRNKKEAE